MLSVDRKHVQLVKIYMPCNFEVNLIIRLGVIPLFSSFFSSPDPKANVKKIFSSETAWPNGAKLGIDGPWVCPF